MLHFTGRESRQRRHTLTRPQLTLSAGARGMLAAASGPPVWLSFRLSEWHSAEAREAVVRRRQWCLGCSGATGGRAQARATAADRNQSSSGSDSDAPLSRRRRQSSGPAHTSAWAPIGSGLSGAAGRGGCPSAARRVWRAGRPPSADAGPTRVCLGSIGDRLTRFVLSENGGPME